jgi:hypothetical protein
MNKTKQFTYRIFNEKRVQVTALHQTQKAPNVPDRRNIAGTLPVFWNISLKNRQLFGTLCSQNK